MNSEREVMLAAGYAALERLQYAHEVAIESVVNEVQQRTGERLLARRPGVLDATLQDLAVMEEQTARYAAALVLVRQWMPPGDGRRLGAVLKVIPAQVAHEITDHLRAAGVLAELRVHP